MSKKLSDKGFGGIEMLVAIVVIALLVLGSWLVWHNHHSKKVADNTKAQISTTTKTKTQTPLTDPYAGWKMYTSSLGGFTLKYPVGWSLEASVDGNPVAANDISGRETGLSIASPTNSTKPEHGSVGVIINIITANSYTENNKSPYDLSGTSTTLANGIKIWSNSISTDQTIVDPNAGNPSCAVTMILGKGDISYFSGYPLNSGQYLQAETSYCETQESTTDLSYKQQIESQVRKDGVSIVSSIKFN